MKRINIATLCKIENINTYKPEKSNFHLAFYLLDKKKRIAISNFYVLCNYLDDIVDGNEELYTKKIRIKFWKDILYKTYYGKYKGLQPLTELFRTYSIPFDLLFKVINGIACDLYYNRHKNIQYLNKYCFGVAGVVGLICMHIFTDNKMNSNLSRYAINLGYALQYTNIIRDVAADYKRNYIYIPLSLMGKYNYREPEIANHIYDKRFYKLINHLYRTTMDFYETADNYIKDENKSKLKSAELMKNIYLELLNKIKKNNFHIYEKKIKLTTFEKIKCMLKIIF